jgi:hypothetical protein
MGPRSLAAAFLPSANHAEAVESDSNESIAITCPRPAFSSNSIPGFVPEFLRKALRSKNRSRFCTGGWAGC